MTQSKEPTPERHILKTWPQYFKVIVDGSKKFEVRLNDRNFKVGDTLELREYDPAKQEYCGRYTERIVTYVLTGWGIQPGYCCMSLIKPI